MDQLMSTQSFMEVYPKVLANYNRIPKPESFRDFGNWFPDSKPSFQVTNRRE